MGNTINTKSDFISNIIPNSMKFEDLPEIEHKRHFVGSTDYIDKIRPEHLTHYVMRGKDQYNRLYTVVYYKNNIQTYFQRYTDNDYIWSYGEHIGGNNEDKLVSCCGNISSMPDIMEKIKNVINELMINNQIQTHS